MDTNDQIQYVELSAEEARKVINFAEAIERLDRNPDFRKVIHDGYFTDEARRLTFLTADTALDDKSANAVWAGIRAIAEFRAFLMARKSAGEVARKDLADQLETLEELRNEQDGDGSLEVIA